MSKHTSSPTPVPKPLSDLVPGETISVYFVDEAAPWSHVCRGRLVGITMRAIRPAEKPVPVIMMIPKATRSPASIRCLHTTLVVRGDWAIQTDREAAEGMTGRALAPDDRLHLAADRAAAAALIAKNCNPAFDSGAVVLVNLVSSKGRLVEVRYSSFIK